MNYESFYQQVCIYACMHLCMYAFMSARPHPFDTKKVEVDFSKKSIFMDFRGKKK